MPKRCSRWRPRVRNSVSFFPLKDFNLTQAGNLVFLPHRDRGHATDRTDKTMVVESVHGSRRDSNLFRVASHTYDREPTTRTVLPHRMACGNHGENVEHGLGQTH